ncbi:hypothetical protein KIH77_06050 [Bifidobacterium sp. 82T24]|uniref:hypothetical protein n=1 Tax=Bifidobacterium pluvialisilvae TaxID=2834436 RepID=UPI001C57EAE0|nr:hypothetical protein [Bifidobacterium pluvialisilvae]MBW3088290.1 hypothetical protein [Bifidobacterium pluvialisilvae]
MIIKQSDDGGDVTANAAASAADTTPSASGATTLASGATTQTFPATVDRRAASEAPTQAIDLDRVRAQSADTEAMPPVAETQAIATDSAVTERTASEQTLTKPIAPTPIIDTTINERISTTEPLDVQLASVAQPESESDDAATNDNNTTDGNRTTDAAAASGGNDDLPTQPMIGKPAVNLAGTGQASDDANTGTGATGGPASGPQAAWRQQAAAAQGYADEAQRNGYPGSGETAQATAGPQYVNYPGWNQYAGNPSAPYTPRVEYKKGPSTATVVWGTLLALFAFGGLASTWLFGFTMSPTVWTMLAIAALVVIGLALVIGGVASAIRRRKATNAADGAAGPRKA